MPKIPSGISGQNVVSAFKRLGFVYVRQKGSHIVLKRPGPLKTDLTIVPDHSELARGMLARILKQADVDLTDFLDAL